MNLSFGQQIREEKLQIMNAFLTNFPQNITQLLKHKWIKTAEIEKISTENSTVSFDRLLLQIAGNELAKYILAGRLIDIKGIASQSKWKEQMIQNVTNFMHNNIKNANFSAQMDADLFDLNFDFGRYDLQIAFENGVMIWCIFDVVFFDSTQNVYQLYNHFCESASLYFEPQHHYLAIIVETDQQDALGKLQQKWNKSPQVLIKTAAAFKNWLKNIDVY